MLPDLDNKLVLNACVIDDVVDLAEQMSNPVMLKDSRGRYLYANQSSITLFGLSYQTEVPLNPVLMIGLALMLSLGDDC